VCRGAFAEFIESRFESRGESVGGPASPVVEEDDHGVVEVEDQSQRIADAQHNSEFFVSNNWLTRLENTNAVPASINS
jgi:hypothetical protein